MHTRPHVDAEDVEAVVEAVPVIVHLVDRDTHVNDKGGIREAAGDLVERNHAFVGHSKERPHDAETVPRDLGEPPEAESGMRDRAAEGVDLVVAFVRASGVELVPVGGGGRLRVEGLRKDDSVRMVPAKGQGWQRRDDCDGFWSRV